MMVAPDDVTSLAPPTPSWTRSEDVRQCLNVLDQVLSEFDDNADDSETESFLEDKFVVTSAVTESKNKLRESRFDISFETKEKDTTAKENDKLGSAAPVVDRSKKPKEVPPALPKKVGSLQLNKIISSDTDFTDINKPENNRNAPKDGGSQSSIDSFKTASDGNQDNTIKSNGSSHSKDSLGSSSSGTHDYQEINSDLCEAIKQSHQKQLEEEERLEQRQRYLKHQQQKRILQENLRNAQRSRGRSIEPKRRSNENRESRNHSKGRSNNRSGRRESSVGRNKNENFKRSKSSERCFDPRSSKNYKRNFKADQVTIPPYIDDPRVIDPLLVDPRFLIENELIDPHMIDPFFVGDPRLIESHMVDPHIIPPPGYDHMDSMGYPVPDHRIPFQHLLNYPEHHPPPPSAFMGPHMRHPADYPEYPIHPYDMPPYMPELAGLTPEEIHHLQAGLDPMFMQQYGPYIEYNQAYPGVPYPMEYFAMGYHPHDYPIPYPPHPPFDDFQPPLQSTPEKFGPPSPEEAKRTIELMMNQNSHPLGQRTTGPTPAQLVKELRRSCRHPVPHRRPGLETSELSSSNYEDSSVDPLTVPPAGGRGVGAAGGFRVGEVVGVKGVTTPPSSLPHLSHGKDSGFDESPVVEESSSLANEGVGGSSVRTIGKTKGAMVVSGVLNNVSNMYIPAPPSPLPDYDDDEHSDGCESDILKGSQFYVIEGDKPETNSNINKKNNRNAKPRDDKPADNSINNSSKMKNSDKAKVSVDEENRRNARCVKKVSATDRILKENMKDSAVATTSASSLQKAGAENSLEVLMNKFHESLPHINALEEAARFSDDSLEDEDTSTVLTSKPSTIDTKSFCNASIDSLCSANDSSASFDYVRGHKWSQNKMGRSNSQIDSSKKQLSNDALQSRVKKSVSNTNLTYQDNFGISTFSSKASSSRDVSSISSGNTSTVSSESAKFDTIKNMLKKGLIQGLDEGPPDFEPPPLTNSKLIQESDRKSSSASSSSRFSKESTSENNTVFDSQNMKRENGKANESLLRNGRSSFDTKKSRNENIPDRKYFEKRSSSSFSESNRKGKDQDDIPPPLPPPRDTSLSQNELHSSQQQLSNGIGSSRKSSLRNKLFGSKTSLEKKASLTSHSRKNSNECKSPEPEMMEVSIYTRTARDGDRVTHIDDFGNELSFQNSNDNNGEKIYDISTLNKKTKENSNGFPTKNESNCSLSSVDSLDSKTNNEPYRKRSGSQPPVMERNSINNQRESTPTKDIFSREKLHSPSKMISKSSNSDLSSNGNVKNDILRSVSPSKKRQPPPPPPSSRVRPDELSRTKSSSPTGKIISGNSRSFIDSLDYQDTKRTTSLVISPNKKGQAPSIPRTNARAPSNIRSGRQVTADPPSTGYMPAEESDSKSRFNFLKGFWRKTNKYSFDRI